MCTHVNPIIPSKRVGVGLGRLDVFWERKKSENLFGHRISFLVTTRNLKFARIAGRALSPRLGFFWQFWDYVLEKFGHQIEPKVFKN